MSCEEVNYESGTNWECWVLSLETPPRLMIKPWFSRVVRRFRAGEVSEAAIRCGCKDDVQVQVEWWAFVDV